MNVEVNKAFFMKFLQKVSGLGVFGLVILLIGLVLGWAIFGQAAPAWAGMFLTWTVFMVLLWCTVAGLTTGFAGRTSLDEFLYLLKRLVEKHRRGEPIDQGEALVLVACSIRSGFLLLMAAWMMDTVFGYLHPMGG